MFVSTDARQPYPRGVIRSTVGAYPRGTGSNPVEGNGHFFPSYRRLYLSSFSDTHTHTHTECPCAVFFTISKSAAFEQISLLVYSRSLHVLLSAITNRYDVAKTVGEVFQMVSFSLGSSRLPDSEYTVNVHASKPDVTSILDTVDNTYTPADSSLGRTALSLLAGSRVKGYERICQVLSIGRVLTVLGQVSPFLLWLLPQCQLFSCFYLFPGRLIQ